MNRVLQQHIKFLLQCVNIRLNSFQVTKTVWWCHRQNKDTFCTMCVLEPRIIQKLQDLRRKMYRADQRRYRPQEFGAYFWLLLYWPVSWQVPQLTTPCETKVATCWDNRLKVHSQVIKRLAAHLRGSNLGKVNNNTIM